uniref:GPI inositol-deacylase n=1 Tax=Culex tarsalis TaxID=7177 RepID=A0A1Q3G1I1_CULTA
MISKLTTVFSLLCLLLFMYGILINLTKVEENRCKMTYMFEYPQFVRIDIPENENFPAYGLYGYSEGKLTERVRNMDYTGAPVLFIPGNGGSYKQARSLASVALRKGIDNGWRNHLDFFTVDFNEEYSGLYGGVLNNQIKYASLCVRRILNLYERRSNEPVSIVLIGHSLGGKIAQAVASMDNLSLKINTIIAISAPIDNPVLSMDHYYYNFYSAVQEQWTSNRTFNKKQINPKAQKSLDNILFLTIGGGIRDTLVDESLTNSVFSDMHAMTHNIPNVWISADHLCVVWCLQFVLAVNRFLHSMIEFDKNSNSKFINSKEIRLMKAFQYFKDESFPGAAEETRLSKNKVDTEDWIEDIRRNFQHKFDTGLSRARVQMIRLDPNPLYKFLNVDVFNLDTKDWIFGCEANEMLSNMRYCSNAVSLSNYSQYLPDNGFSRQNAQINLHLLKIENPRWTHVILKFPKTTEPFQFNIDINNIDDRTVQLHMPKWFNFRQNELLETQLDSTFYHLNIHGLSYKYQAVAIYVHVKSCRAENPSVVTKISNSWPKGFEKYSSFYNKNHSVTFVYSPIDKPLEQNASVHVSLHLNPSCRYSISYSQSLSLMMSRVVQQFAQWLPAHCTAILLLSLKHQITVSTTEDHFKFGKFHSALSKSSPFFLITASRVFTKIALMFKIIPQPDLYNYSMMISFLIHGVALAVLILMNTIIWIAIAFCGNFGHKLLLRFVSLPIPPFSSALVSCVRKFPTAIGVLLIAVSLASCGGTALLCANMIYFILLSKMYEEYLEQFVFRTAKRISQRLFGKKKSTTNTDKTKSDDSIASISPSKHSDAEKGHEMNNIQFHLPLFMLLLVISIINIPCFISWAKAYRITPSLKPDASLVPALVVLSSLSILWQIRAPKNIQGYKFLSAILYIAAVICILYCQGAIYRLNFVIAGVFIVITLHQLLGRNVN